MLTMPLIAIVLHYNIKTALVVNFYNFNHLTACDALIILQYHYFLGKFLDRMNPISVPVGACSRPFRDKGGTIRRIVSFTLKR